MGLRNFLGLGILFGAKDEGLEKKQKGITDNFKQMGDAVEHLNKLVGLNRMSTLVQSLSLDKLSEISDKIQNIGVGGLNLTTGFEAQLTHMSKSAKEAGVNFGYAGKEMKTFVGKSVGMGIALNMGADEAAKAVRNWDVAKDSLKALGLESAKDLAKLAGVTHVNAEVFAESTRRMSKEMGFSNDSIKAVMSSMTKFGQVSGNLSGTLEQVPQLLEMLSQKAALAGKSMDPKVIAGWGQQVAGVATALRKVVPESGKAMSMAMNIAQTMLSAEQDIGGLFAGTANDLPNFVTELGIAQGDVQKVFDQMREGPMGFISGLTEMMEKAKVAGKDTNEVFNFLHKRIQAAGIPQDQAAIMMNFLRKADKETISLAKETTSASVSFKKLSKEYSDGRTLADRFELTHDVLVKGFRDIGRVQAEVFVRDAGKQFRSFKSNLDEIVKDGGPLGKLIEKFSQMHQLGALALIPKTLRPMAALFGTVAKEMIPVITALGALGLRFGMLFHPLTLIIAGFAGLVLLLKATGKNTEGRQKDFDRIKGWFRGIVESIREFIGKLPQLISEVGGLIKEFAPVIGPPLVEAFHWALGMVKDHILPYLGELMKGLFEGLAGEATNSSASQTQKMGASIGEFLRKAFWAAIDYVGAYLKKWWDTIGTIWADDSLTFKQKMKKVFVESSGVIAGVAALALFTPIFSIAGTLISIVGPVISMLISLFGGLFSVIGFLGSVIGTLFSFLMPVAAAVGSFIASLFSIPGLIAVVVAAVAALIVGLLFFPEKTKEILGKVADAIKRGFLAFGGWLKNFFLVTIPSFFKGFLGAIAMFSKGIIEFLLNPIKSIQETWDALVGTIGRVYNKIKEMAKGAMIWRKSAEAEAGKPPPVATPTTAPGASVTPAVTPPVPPPVMPKMAMSTDMALMNAINMPGWYEDFKTKVLPDILRASRARSAGVTRSAPTRVTRAPADNGTLTTVSGNSAGLPTVPSPSIPDMEGME